MFRIAPKDKVATGGLRTPLGYNKPRTRPNPLAYPAGRAEE